jgi:hypothetical protein
MNQIFEQELKIVSDKFPNLVRKQNSWSSYLKGILDIKDENGNVAGSFLIEIHQSESFPYRFPKLYEVGGDIPMHADWHKYNDNSCCLTVEPDEIIICRNGISIIDFIENIAVPYFANQIYRKREGRFLNEYPHGFEGFRVFYANLFKSDDTSLWLNCIDRAFSSRKGNRNDKCYCNSGIKYKNCHLPIENKLKILGKNKILIDLENIIK